VQYVQRAAQWTKELVVFQVYIHLMHLNFGLLDPKNGLDLPLSLLVKSGGCASNGEEAHNPKERLQLTSQLPETDNDLQMQML
jgi:hypothetical protein